MPLLYNYANTISSIGNFHPGHIVDLDPAHAVSKNHPAGSVDSDSVWERRECVKFRLFANFAI